MSFSENVKNEIWENMPKKPCCRRALLLGMFAVRGRIEGDHVTLCLDGERNLQTAEALIAEQFGREAKRVKRQDAVVSSMLSFYYGNVKTKINIEAGSKWADDIPEKCPSCRRWFLIGTFLAAGRICDPQKQYLLEFSCGESREEMAKFLVSFGLLPKYADRRREKILYFRDSTSIEELFTHMGVAQVALAVMNQKIEHDMRNQANRLANCDANNIGKAISASMRQVELIRQLIAENKLSFLPPELEKTALLRLEYDGLSVGQLAAIAEPPLTKSGLHHRLQKITELATALLEEKKGGV